jgi:hypothetical protein
MDKDKFLNPYWDAILDDNNFSQEDFIPYLAVIGFGKKVYEINTQLKNYLSESNTIAEIASVISIKTTEYINKNPGINKKCETLRCIFDNNEKVDILKKAVLGRIKSIPRDYKVTFTLENVICLDQAIWLNEFKINKSVILKFSKSSTNLGALFPYSFKNSSPFNHVLSIEIKYKGYLTAEKYEEPYSILKQIIYLALISDIFIFNKNNNARIKNKQSTVLGEMHSIELYRFEENDLHTPLILSPNDASFLNQLSFKNNTLNIKENIQSLSYLFQLANKRKSILMALEWGYESDTIPNQTFRFVLKFIALESLLGDKKNVVETLTNRCAFLLADTHEERESLLIEIPKLYKLRSELIHGNKSLLGYENHKKLDSLNEILKRVIFTELMMLHGKFKRR